MQAMSAADGWDLTVPADEAEFPAELRRHGVRPVSASTLRRPAVTTTKTSAKRRPGGLVDA